jgi:hypothetical protein
MLMSEPQPSREKELEAMTISMIKGSVGLLTGHTTLRAHKFKLELTAAGLPTVREQKVK